MLFAFLEPFLHCLFVVIQSGRLTDGSSQSILVHHWMNILLLFSQKGFLVVNVVSESGQLHSECFLSSLHDELAGLKFPGYLLVPFFHLADADTKILDVTCFILNNVEGLVIP